MERNETTNKDLLDRIKELERREEIRKKEVAVDCCVTLCLSVCCAVLLGSGSRNSSCKS
jgi:hypothetical protein